MDENKFRTHQEITWAEGYEATPRYVVCAANRYGNIIISGARHHDNVMRSQVRAIGAARGADNNSMWRAGFSWLLSQGEEEQGFIDQFGVFMGRAEANFVVRANKQIIKESGKIGTQTLFSENLY